MYIPIKPIIDKYKIPTKGVIQVGAHWAEEHEDYLSAGIKKFVYIEPCNDAWSRIVKNLKLSEGFSNHNMEIMGIKNDVVKLYPVACGSKKSMMNMYVSKQNQGQSNSLLKSKLHSIQHPDILFTDTEVVNVFPLDTIIYDKEEYNILVTDCEGYDGEVIKGAAETLKHIDLVYSEINRDETREGNMLVNEFEDLLWDNGFVKIQEYWPSPNFSWGDAVFISRKLLT